jgi:hypothetical protein
VSAITVLTPLQLNAGAGLLQNQGISVSSSFTAAIDTYQAIPIISTLWSAIELAASGNAISNTTIATMESLTANSCPALSDSVPTGYSITVQVDPPGFSGALSTVANSYIPSGDISRFAQAFSIAESYAYQTNLFVNTAVNSQTYLGNTFTNMNDMITGDVTSVNLATSAFGSDLKNLGQLIDLSELDNLGSPLALVQRLLNLVGDIPLLSLIFVSEGVPEEIVININNPTISISDSVQKLLYQAMTKIKGDLLTQILTVFGVTTVNIETMADLLNPVKLFPNSFQSLTTPTANGIRAIYTDPTGSVNSNLLTELPEYVLRTVV